MSNWKYADASNKVVSRTNEDGSFSSCEVVAIAGWLAEGNTPDPADPLPNPRINEIKSQLDTLDFKKIRPLAAGDTEYLAILQAQTVALQDELKGLLYPAVVAEPNPEAPTAVTEATEEVAP